MEYLGNLPLATEVVAGMIQADGLDWVYKAVTNQYSRLEALHAGDLRSKADNVQLSFTVSYAGTTSGSASTIPTHRGSCLKQSPRNLAGWNPVPPIFKRETPGNVRIPDLLRMLHHRGLLQRVDSNYRLHPLLHNYRDPCSPKIHRYKT